MMISHRPPSRNDPTGHQKYSGEIMKLRIFSRNWKYRDREINIFAILYDGTCIVFDGEAKVSTGKQRKQGEENDFNSNLEGKHIFLTGHPFTLAGPRFSGVVTGGVISVVAYWRGN